MFNDQHNLSDFCVVGINYRKSDVIIRGNFSLTSEQSQQLLDEMKAEEITSGLVLSTCNRTEVYGICKAEQLMKLLCIHTHGAVSEFNKYGYIKQGLEAVEHLFKVAAGLDSQIIGDYEILSQLKLAVKVARQHECIDPFMERVINYVLQASKEIKTTTDLSSGTVSVAYAAVEIIREKVADWKDKKVLLVGTGKFGNNVADNINTYLPGIQLSVANRTNEKAILLAEQFGATYIPYDQLSSVADAADIIIVSSSAENYTIISDHFVTEKSRLLLDLSVPQNIDPALKYLKGVELLNVDEISCVLDATINKRKAEIPKAMSVISATIAELMEWYKMQANSSFLKVVKSQLNDLADKSLSGKKEDIKKTISYLAIQLKKENNKGCQCIHALSNYLQPVYEATA